MARWITFDECGFRLLAHRAGHAVYRGHGDPLLSGLAASSPAMVVSSGPQGKPRVITIRHGAHDAPPVITHFEAAGFLGLSDEEVTDDLPQPKSWWKRLWE